MDTDFWVVHTTHGQYRVDTHTASELRAKVAHYAGKPYQENQELSFEDAAGSQVYIVLATYLGVLESTREQRAWDRDFNRRLDVEKDEDTPSWD